MCCCLVAIYSGRTPHTALEKQIVIGKYQSNNWQWVKQKQCSGITDYSQVTVLSSYQAIKLLLLLLVPLFSPIMRMRSELRNSKF